MKKFTAILLILLLLGTNDLQAQRRRKVVKQKQPEPEVVEETPQEILFKSMVANTAKVMFIDSLVVDKKNFLNFIPLSTEAGMMIPYNELFDKTGQDASVVYANELGTTCYYSELQNDSTRYLYTIDKLGKSWSTPRRLNELNQLKMPNYPFLMTDGLTLFFSAKSSEGLGGYDIYMTRFDSEGARFYIPENYGLPFNSPANEYFLAIDEYQQLGYLVSDRYQPKGKVCIYIFEPLQSHRGFEADNISEKKLYGYARLTKIKDTWSFGNREEALKRYNGMKSRNLQGGEVAELSFVVNDNTVYHSVEEFHSKEAQKLFQEYQTKWNRMEKTTINLERQRIDFSKQTLSKQQNLRGRMLQEEESVLKLKEELQNLAKRIRKIENSNNH